MYHHELGEQHRLKAWDQVPYGSLRLCNSSALRTAERTGQHNGLNI
jgi:hypothetical protein